MTTITTGTSGPKAWKIALVGAAAGLAALVVVNLPTTTDNVSSQDASSAPRTATAELPESVTGFEYNNESTTGRTVSPGVTTQYGGNSGELMPFENGAAPVQAPTGFGGPEPQTVPDQATIDGFAPVITQEFLDGPSSGAPGATRVDPRAAVDAGLNPGSIDAIVGGTVRSVPTPDNLADAHVRAETAPANPPGSVGVPDAATNARWEALVEAYRNGSASSHYTRDPDPAVDIPSNAAAGVGTDARWEAFSEAYETGSISTFYLSAEPNPADRKFLEGQPGTGSQPEAHVSMTNNQIR